MAVRSAYGPFQPKSEIVTTIDRGESASNCCGSMPSDSARARPPVITTTSAAATMARHRALRAASGATVMLRLPALR